MKEIVIDGVVYEPKTPEAPRGPLTLVVLDNGFIFVGKLEKAKDVAASWRLSQCENVRHAKDVGIGGLTKGAKYASAVLDASEPITFRTRRIVYTSQLPEGWHDI